MSDQFKLSREIEAVMALKASLGEMIGDDAELLADTVEGQTDIHEAIAAVFASMDEDDILLTGIAARTDELTARKQRISKRITAKRAIIEHAMSIAEIKTIEAPLATLSLKRKPPGLIIEDEAVVPASFWKQPDPVLDKSKIKAALNAKETVLGASLDNGGVSLSVRRR